MECKKMAVPPIDPMDTDLPLSKKAFEFYLANPSVVPMAFLIESTQWFPEDEQERIGAEKMLRCCAKNHPLFLARKLSEMFASPGVGTGLRGVALHLLHKLLVDLEENETALTFSDIQECGKTLFSCPINEEISTNVSKDYSKAISNLAARLSSLTIGGDWSDLRSYISSALQVNFRKAAQIFEDLRIPLSDNFLNPLLYELKPRIVEALEQWNTNTENWVSAFGFAFALSVQLMYSQRKKPTGKIISSAVNSAAELVVDGKEDLVRRGLLNVEAYLRENVKRFNRNAYDFSTEFIRVINGITGIGEESKQIAERITEVLEG